LIDLTPPKAELKLTGFLLFLTAQACGQVISKTFTLPIPGTVVGILLALCVCCVSPKVAAASQASANMLLPHFGLFLVPIGPSVLMLPKTLLAHGPAVFAVTGISAVLTLAVSMAVFAVLSKLSPERQATGEVAAGGCDGT
jgi:putative effector of murein hydrolase LrgA (UPF0299 family)